MPPEMIAAREKGKLRVLKPADCEIAVAAPYVIKGLMARGNLSC